LEAFPSPSSLWGPPPLSSSERACYMGRCRSPLLQSSGCPALFATCPFFCGAEISLSRGLCWFFLGVAVGEPCATYLVPCGSAKRVRGCFLAAQEPSWFFHILWCGGAMCGLGVWRIQSFASSWWFFLSSVSQHLRKIFTLMSTCYLLPPSSRHLGNSPLNNFRKLFISQTGSSELRSLHIQLPKEISYNSQMTQIHHLKLDSFCQS
jgi:hypothetical protein